MYPVIRIKKGFDKRLSGGHHWVFSNELESIPELPPGSVVELKSFNDSSWGIGFYNSFSLISFRLLFANPDTELSTQLFRDRISKALKYRESIGIAKNSYRLVFGESDLLPGLIIDKFADYFTIQVLSAGMEKNINQICESLLSILPDTKGIIEKNDNPIRLLEGLELREGILFGKIPDNIFIEENGIKYGLDLAGSQKTGFYLDQSINRAFLQSISNGKMVLDCFTNQGGFAFNAAKGGALRVVGVDSSKPVLELAIKNAELNSFPNMKFIDSDILFFLKKEIAEKAKWDIIILDPPAFAKSKKQVANAKIGYSRINSLALKLINNGGFLVTSSCSQHISEELFMDIIRYEAAKQQIQLRLVYRGMQSPDHPVLCSMPETQYLKFFVFEVKRVFN